MTWTRSLNRRNFSPVLAAATACLIAQQAQAQSDWTFTVTPYAWLAGLDGEIATLPQVPEAAVDLSFGDIWDDLDYSAMVLASARKGPWVILADLTSVKTTTRQDVDAPAVNDVSLESTTTNFSLALGRTLVETADYRVGAFAGARAWWLDNDYAVDLAPPNDDIRRDTDTDWVSPILGMDGIYRLDDRWRLLGSLSIGGFGVGADYEWRAFAGADYAFEDWVALSFGWRHMGVDYDDDGEVYDIQQGGPVVGATFRF